MHSTPDQDSPDRSVESPVVERAREQHRAAVKRGEIAAGLLGPAPEMAQPLKEIREAAITWLRAKAKAGTSDPEGTNEVIDEFLEEKKELEEAASTGRMNEGAKRMIYAFNSGVETNAQSVIDGADDFDEDRREHLRSVAADIAKRFTPKS